MNALLQAALDYAVACRLPVFPCAPGEKIPAFKGSFHHATTNPATIERWWRAKPYNIGVPTGAPSGFWVLDTDPERNGEASLRALEAVHGALPRTHEVITVRSGRHSWFKYVGHIPCSADKIAPGLDVRGDGGYVVVPPSIWKNGRTYTWSVDSADEIAEAPEWLVALARKTTIIPISERARATIPLHAGAPSSYGRAALEYEIEALSIAAPGSRNHALNRAAFSLFQLVAGGELGEAEVFNALVAACHANGLMTDLDDGPRTVAKTIASGRRAGLKNPRSRPGAA